ncbi:hypothetical protein GA0061098_10547 [Bradyrhizobium shewense]|uniref:Uncharacterized protein n=1 Tax=Bradyrhizobium shewense TaxID=1761772 RepID=A0A1C3XUU3_9BRAD|nr:hypothetical protein GA0061098_10547 [Bradyrhizobium shewense]
MQARDLLERLTGQHDELHSASTGRAEQVYRAFQPTIELRVLLLVESARALDLGRGQNF